jgi:diadenosine tetraphosphatase ApaH/serine/threonine PP2A family protein phosphatase
MPEVAIVSDIHGNLEALLAVLEEIRRLGLQRVISLGDTIGYGPDPVDCLKLAVQRFEIRLMGNHEYFLLDRDFFPMTEEATRAAEWTKRQIAAAGMMSAIETLPIAHREADVVFVHGSVREPLTDYVTERDRHGYSRFEEIVQSLERFEGFRLCFVGHNHRPFLATGEGFIHPHDDVMEFQLTGERAYACVGSVGQPRDGDPRACFATFDGVRIRYHRVSYPTQLTAAKIRERGLPARLAERLLVGS